MYTKNISQERYYTPLRGKAAYLRDWQNNPVKLDHIPSGENVGLLLEHAGLTDIDLDSPEIKAMLPRFVPTNTLTIGRGGVASHYLYDGELSNDEDMKDLHGHKMVEIRHKGKQVMWVGSIHPDPPHETIEVMKDVAPLPVPDHEDVLKAYTAAVIAKHLPTGDRHNLAMAYAGYLLRQGLTENEVYEILYRSGLLMS